MPARFARPKEANGPLPVVLVVQEILAFTNISATFVAALPQKATAVAPELYFRQGDPSEYSDIKQLFEELVSKVPDAQVLADLDHVANWAARHGGDMRNMAITGFCWGGRIVWLYAAHNPQLKAGVARYGRLVGEKTMKQSKHPVDIAVDLNAPVLGLYGAKDEGIPLESIETMRRALNAANATAEIIVYPEAGHAFNADYRPSYHEASAKMVGNGCWRGSISMA